MADAYEATEYGLCPSWAVSLGYVGVATGAVLSNWGSAVSWILPNKMMISLFDAHPRQ